MTRFRNNLAAMRHVALCDNVSHDLSQAATLRFMQYNSEIEANRGVAVAKKLGTGLADLKITTGLRIIRMQQGIGHKSSRRSISSNDIDNNF